MKPLSISFTLPELKVLEEAARVYQAESREDRIHSHHVWEQINRLRLAIEEETVATISVKI